MTEAAISAHNASNHLPHALPETLAGATASTWQLHPSNDPFDLLIRTGTSTTHRIASAANATHNTANRLPYAMPKTLAQATVSTWQPHPSNDRFDLPIRIGEEHQRIELPDAANSAQNAANRLPYALPKRTPEPPIRPGSCTEQRPIRPAHSHRGGASRIESTRPPTRLKTPRIARRSP